MEKYGFVYVWFDRKHKRFYLGRHWGTETDGYICSSTNMRNNYNNRPQDFKRRIISKTHDKNHLVIEEQRWLDMIGSHELNKKYYNKTKSATTPSTKGYNHSEETKLKISTGNKGKKVSEETKELLRQANKKQFEDEYQRELRRKKFLELWSDPEYRKIQIEKKKGKKQSIEQIEKRVKSNKEKWKSQGHKNRGPQSEEAKLKISKAFSEMIWINNGKENRRINKNKEIPCGYVKGRLRNGS